MKSIEDTLEFVGGLVKAVAEHDEVAVALAGGYACIAHGVARTTVDVDFCFYAESMKEERTGIWADRLRNVVPKQMEITFVPGSKMPDDPFGHDILFLEDKNGAYPRIDMIFPKYKWELEGIRAAAPLEDISFPVLPKPYLVAMKLAAGGPKDDSDVIELFGLMTEEEKKKATELARRIRKDRKLASLTTPTQPERIQEDPDLLL